jgi:hypothetical protein
MVLLITLHEFLDIIISLRGPWELGLHFKNKKKLFARILRITNLYVKRISNIKIKI